MKDKIKNSNDKYVKYVKYICKIMFCYCLMYRKNTESKNPKVAKTKNIRIRPLSKCEVCDSQNRTYKKNLVDY